MSDSEDSTVTYTEAPPLPYFIPEHVYLEFMPPADEVFLAEEQPLPAAVSATTDSPGYIADFDPEKDPTDYPVDGGDDDVDDDGSSDDEEDDDDNDDDDDEEDEDEDEEEEEYPAPVNFILPPPVHRTTARISIPVQAPTPFWSEAEIDKLLAIPSPLPAPLSLCPTYPLGYRATMIRLRAETPSTSHSPPPNHLDQRHHHQGHLLPIPLPTSLLLLLLPSTRYRVNVPKVTLSPQKRLCIALGLRYEVSKSSFSPIARPARGFRVDYGFVATLDDEIRCDCERDVGSEIIDTWDEMLVVMPGVLATNETELGRRMSNFVTTVRQDTDEIYERLDDAQDDKVLMSGVSTTVKDCMIAGSRPYMTDTASRGTDSAKDTTDTDGSIAKMARTH
uniref:Reverse transcriptase domain-containing protein n=1 Tax=Tanacetum cinerariifolium TaxID=118510 RepID=A0A6L2NBL8_TANCI|nr:hypothetical protein [Tanacetum cinerariifolium]